MHLLLAVVSRLDGKLVPRLLRHGRGEARPLAVGGRSGQQGVALHARVGLPEPGERGSACYLVSSTSGKQLCGSVLFSLKAFKRCSLILAPSI